jgi:hypothetical protein
MPCIQHISPSPRRPPPQCQQQRAHAAGQSAVGGGGLRARHLTQAGAAAGRVGLTIAAGLQPTHPVLPARAGLAAGARRTGAADTLGSAAHLAGRPSLTPTGLGRDLIYIIYMGMRAGVCS